VLLVKLFHFGLWRRGLIYPLMGLEKLRVSCFQGNVISWNPWRQWANYFLIGVKYFRVCKILSFQVIGLIFNV
jgi:hypothetical protein